MKQLIFILIFTLVLFSSFCEAGENIVDSKILSVSDVKAYFQSHSAQEIEVIGIYQEGNEAVVYYEISYTKPKNRRELFDSRLIRFNSGKWFDPVEKIFVTK